MTKCCVFCLESFYRERYIQKSKEQDQLRKKLQNQAEEEIEELSNQKRTLERKVKKLFFLIIEMFWGFAFFLGSDSSSPELKQWASSPGPAWRTTCLMAVKTTWS